MLTGETDMKPVVVSVCTVCFHSYTVLSVKGVTVAVPLWTGRVTPTRLQDLNHVLTPWELQVG